MVKKKKLSKEHRYKLSQSHKGKKFSEEHKRNISKSNKGHIVTQQTRNKIGKSNKGKKQNKDTIKKRIASRKLSGGFIWSKKSRKKLSRALKGKKQSQKTIKEKSLRLKGKKLSDRGHKLNCPCSFCKAKRGERRGKNHPFFGITGKKHPGWVNGTAEIKYPRKFHQVKDYILNRDNFTCQCCGITEEEHLKLINQILHIHHIDYNRFMNNKKNLITTCLWCNLKANGERDYWFAYYTYIMKNWIKEK